MESGSGSQVRDLLEDDEYLLEQSLKQLNVCQQAMRQIFEAIRLIHACLHHIQGTKKTSFSDLSVRALSGELGDSPMVEDILATARTLDSEKLGELLETMPNAIYNNVSLAGVRRDLKALLERTVDCGPLRSGYNVNSSVVKTTVAQQRFQLTKGKTNLSEQDIEYTKVIDRLIGALQEYFAETLIPPQDLFLHEVFLFDLRNPLKETFTPRPRFAIERAMANPFDYLFSSASAAETKISAKQPATAILYQLYLESGALINVHDLWQAFYGVFESDQGSKCDDRIVMTLFYNALSDLKSFGMVKNSRKKADHLAKSAWMGL